MRRLKVVLSQLGRVAEGSKRRRSEGTRKSGISNSSAAAERRTDGASQQRAASSKQQKAGRGLETTLYSDRTMRDMRERINDASQCVGSGPGPIVGREERARAWSERLRRLSKPLHACLGPVSGQRGRVSITAPDWRRKSSSDGGQGSGGALWERPILCSFDCERKEKEAKQKDGEEGRNEETKNRARDIAGQDTPTKRHSPHSPLAQPRSSWTVDPHL
ncbi:hypothetical protein PMIN01_09300 [Paraphaeosphaeria minitans]|uniref:Uncharacterized protein n=1 Tax=Paraphaeosphaeria minitans TaxID=565426 RepID=A0A9P6KMX6_9PLEO|nr:hypothetical protein PMIN01_09300 [Paraphaeosphaeria minitans]